MALTTDFSATPTSGTAPLSVNFTDISTGSPTSWAWDFGDGNTSTDQNPTHVYSQAKTYTVSLTATNGMGTDTETKVDYINVNMGTDFSASPSSNTYPYSIITFQDSTTGTPTAWAWDFGDGTTSTLQNPTKSYGSTGYYTVTLVASNAYKSDTEVKYNYVHVNLVGIAQKINYIHTYGPMKTWDVAPPIDILDMSVMSARGSASYNTLVNGLRVSINRSGSVIDSGFKRQDGPTIIFD